MIDTATQFLSLALFEDGNCVAHHHEQIDRGHAERLLPAIAALPDGGRAERIAVDVGPGSFTGVRIGLAAARALAFAWGADLAGYSALSLIAAAVRDAHKSADTFPVAITGGHGELFWQMFSSTSRGATTELKSTPITMLAELLDDNIIYGTGAQALVDARNSGTAMNIYPDARLFPLLFQADASLPAKPLYGREADAKPMTAGAPS